MTSPVPTAPKDLETETPPASLARPSRAVVFDALEKLLVLGLYGNFAYVALVAFLATYNVATLLMLLSESIPLGFVIFRKSSAGISLRPIDWLVAVPGTVFPLLVVPAATAVPLAPAAVCVSIIMVGMTLEITAKTILGRSFGIVAANRGVEQAGPYRLMRHPMYAGYTLTHIGLVMLMPSPRTAILYAVAFAFQVARIVREERWLSQDPEYREFSGRVRYRLIPGVF